LARIDDIIADFEILEDWEDKYRHVIDLGRDLPRLAAHERSDANKVQGCASQVWLVAERGAGDGPLVWRGESDAHIVQGLIAVLLALYSGRSAQEALAVDALALFKQLGLADHLTAQRSNGLRAMVERIRADARAALAAA
jgi:cysteine desulfuration protein SufE